MSWFRKAKHAEIWDQTIEEPVGDIEAAQRIRDICRSAADSAERLGRIAEGAGNTRRKSDIRQNKHASERYQCAARAAMEIAMKVSDDLMRDVAVRQIVELCLTAKDLKTDRILLRAIQSASISNDLLKEHPELEAE